MKQSIYPLSLIFNMNTRLFINALEGVTEEQAKERITAHNNPIIWIAAHTVSARYLALFFLGKPADNPFHEMFTGMKGYDAAINYPTLAEVMAVWEKVSSLLGDAMQSVTEEQLALDAQYKRPIGDFTNGGSFAFMAQHESYDIGQLAFLKKYYTQAAMKY